MNHRPRPIRTAFHPARAARTAAVAALVMGVAAPLRAAVETEAERVANGAVARSGFLSVFERLDPTGIALVVGAAVVLLLLVARLVAMFRREKPVVVPPPRRARGEPRVDDASLEQPTLRGTTDWGADQNKRAAQVRVAIDDAALPSLDQDVTQWTLSEVHQSALASRQAVDSLGKPPDATPSPYRTAFNPYYQGASPLDTKGLEVVEVADTLLQAELLVQLGDPKQAMTLLSNHIRETEKPGPAIWLMLLNLYQTTGRKSQYEALAVGFKTLFNAQVPAWATSKEIAARTLESYPQVMARLHGAWGKPAVRPLIDGLLNDDRGGSRQGFSLAAYREILFLLGIAEELVKMDTEDTERAGIRRKLGAGT